MNLWSAELVQRVVKVKQTGERCCSNNLLKEILAFFFFLFYLK